MAPKPSFQNQEQETQSTTGPPTQKQSHVISSDSSSNLKVRLPTEIEIKIISFIPLSYFHNICLVCKRWLSITRLSDVLYTVVKTRTPEQPPPDFKPVTFKLHRAVYELEAFWDLNRTQISDSDWQFWHDFVLTSERSASRNQSSSDTQCIPNKTGTITKENALKLVTLFKDDQITIPSMPHTLWQVAIKTNLAATDISALRSAAVAKTISIPGNSDNRVLCHRTPVGPNISNLGSENIIYGITVRQLFAELVQRTSFRLGDYPVRFVLCWTITDKQNEWWWNEWDGNPGKYELPLFRLGYPVEPYVLYTKC
ncbi:hypothetical protein TWF694_011526 [Orbilia ellipsospora]|uniref:F-box domain-containing protein n=1 Tax=Orbilia ellipsospora TaxID=2528407 RepID=A0AAV9X5G0_9PEZI